MSREKDDYAPETYYIPPNYVDSSGVFGGMFKLRNAIESCVLGLIIGAIVFNVTYNMSLTLRVTILVMSIVPPMFFAAIGVMDLSLTEFLFYLIRFIHRRRIIGKAAFNEAASLEPDIKSGFFNKIHKIGKKLKHRVGAEIDLSKKPKGSVVKNRAGGKRGGYIRVSNEAAAYLPIKEIKNGIVYTTDGRYIKIIEVSPINFLLRSAKEQTSIVWSFARFLKVSPVSMQLKSLSKRADINKFLKVAQADLDKEENEACRELQKDYMNFLYDIGSREAVSRRFFIIFEYEPWMRVNDVEADAIYNLNTVAQQAKSYLGQCGNDVIEHDNEDDFAIDVLYQLLNRRTSFDTPVNEHVRNVVQSYADNFGKSSIVDIPAADFAAPKYIDLSHINYIVMDGVYITYLVVPSYGYRSQVQAGWTSLLVDAGEGIDIDIFLKKEAKDKISRSLGRHIRMNKAKIKDAQDTNDDFDELSGSISGGYYMKRSLANEDFYYMNILVTVTAQSKEILDWRVMQLKKHLISHDMSVQMCSFRMEEAFLSSLPLASIEKSLHKWSRRNMMTSGVASSYPLTSFELCDVNGILLGIIQHNSSLCAVDNYDSRSFANANAAIMGKSGIGKTFFLQTIASRKRCKGIQVFIIAPLKGHEFFRACNNKGGSFIQVSPSSKHCINIMEIRPEDTAAAELIDDAVLEKSLLVTKIQRLHIFFSLLYPEMEREERQLLDDAIIRTYQKFGIGHDNSTLIDPADPNGKRFKPMPILGDLHSVLNEKEGTKKIANILSLLVSGSASTFNQQTNVDLNNLYTVMDISELTGEMLTLGMFVALDFVWDKAKEDRTKQKAVFIDETWRLIGASSNKLAAEFTLELFKIIRGYGGAAIAATQDINDFFALEDGKFGKGIINNCGTKVILGLEDDEANRVQEILGLSESERHAITTFQRGEALICTGKNKVTVSIRASELEKELITTDRRELVAIVERKKAQLARAGHGGDFDFG